MPDTHDNPCRRRAAPAPHHCSTGAPEPLDPRLRDFARLASEGFLETDAALRITWASERCEGLTGLALDAIVGLDLPTLVRSRGAVRGDEWRRFCAYTEGRQDCEAIDLRICAAGATHCCKLRALATRDASGRFRGYRATLAAVDDTQSIEDRKNLAEQRLADALHAVPDGVALFDADDCLITTNGRWPPVQDEALRARIRPGISFEEVLRHAVELAPPTGSRADNPAWVERRMASHRAPEGLRTELALADDVWALVREMPMPDGGRLIVCTDISELRRRERERLASEHRFRHFSQSASDWFWETDREGRFTYLSERFTELTGAPVESLLGKRREDLLDILEEGPTPRSAYLAQIRERRPFRGVLISTENRAGERILIEINGRPVFGVQGRFGGYRGSATDVTQRERAQRELRASEARFRSLVEGSLQGIVIHRDGEYLFVNQAFCNMLGADSPEALLASGRRLDDCFAAHEVQRLRDDRAARLRGEQVPEQYEFDVVRLDGSPARLLNISRVTDWDGTAAIQATYVDITEKSEIEHALRRAQRMESLAQITGGVAHDFNNLLGVVLGNLELLRNADADAGTRSRIEAAIRATTRGSELAGRLLGFARRTPNAGVPLDVDDAVASTLEMITRTLPPKLELEVRPSARAVYADIDPGELDDALLNLALNACDAMPEGGRLLIETATERLSGAPGPGADPVPEGEYVVLSVSDTGTGMSAAVAEGAFEPFYTTKPAESGSGLGLSMVYGFTRRCGGTARIESQPGQGTTVRLYLPVASTAPPAAGLTDAADAGDADEPGGRGETVLVVDDDPDVLDTSLAILEALGYRTLGAEHAAAALDVLESGTPVDVVLTDVVMPGAMDGLELACLLAERRPELPVLVTSGYTNRTGASAAEARVLANLLKKPVETTHLAHALRLALDGCAQR